MYRDDETAARLWEEAAEKRVAELELRRLATGLWQLRETLAEREDLLAALGRDLDGLRLAVYPGRRRLRVAAIGAAAFLSLFLPLMVVLHC